MLLARHSVGNLLENELTRNAALKSGISARELLSTRKKQEEEAQAGNERSKKIPKSSQARKKPPLTGWKINEKHNEKKKKKNE